MEAYQQWSLLVTVGAMPQKISPSISKPHGYMTFSASHDGGRSPRIIDQELKGEGGEISADFEVIRR